MDAEHKNFGRRALLGAIACVSLILGFGRKSEALAAGVGAKSPATPLREVCVECLSRRAAQRTAFINKWI